MCVRLYVCVCLSIASPRKGVPSLNIPAYEWSSAGLHGMAESPGVKFGGPVPSATSFPQVVTTSASFNTTLFNAIGQTISTEARAFSNYGAAGNTFMTPNVNIFRSVCLCLYVCMYGCMYVCMDGWMYVRYLLRSPCVFLSLASPGSLCSLPDHP